MYKFLVILSCTFCFGMVHAQKNMSVLTKHDLYQLQSAYVNKSTETLRFAEYKSKFPIHEFNQQECIALLAKVNASFDANELKKCGVMVGSRIQNIVTLRVPLTQLSMIGQLKGIDYVEIAGKISPRLDKAIIDVRADSVQQGINLPQAYTGKNVYIGICDWGFDYTHPNFYDTSLVQTRIFAAWDQYKRSGPNPANFSYGTEYTTVQSLLSAQSDTANIYSYGYHGSHVAGIAGGSGAGTPYRGVAFDAQYLFATFLIDAASVIDAYSWMYEKAQQAGKRLVINQSWGLHWLGNLDGTSLLSQALDGFSQDGVVFVSSAGNNGNVNFHLKKTFTNDVLKSKVDFYDYSANEHMWGQSLSLWGESGKSFSIGIQVLNSSNVLLVETPYYATDATSNYIDSMLINGTDTIFFNVSCENANPQNNRPHARFRVKNTNTALKIVMKVTAIDGTVHCWNVTELSTDVGNWGMPFSSLGSTYTAGDTQYGISEPACSQSTIAVAAYTTSFQVQSGTWVGGAIAGFSSFGPTLDERIKPDISAPGVNIGSSFSSFTDEPFSAVATVDFNGRTYPFCKISGTSMSGPMVTGIVALILQVNPYLTSDQIKTIIRETARTDTYTGVIPVGGSTRWGMGKVNAYAAVLKAVQTIGLIENYALIQDQLTVYPNPTDQLIQLDFKGNLDGKTIQVVDLNGKITELTLLNQSFSMSDFASGTYLIRLQYEGRIYQQRIVKK